ncbi:MAG: VCBS repeat-containing protein [Gammaproteobacteria bacterium]|jgi:hypothetical protein|nr:VCBS repeat-containing protein [Gammaproteobacteria bacterium]MBT4076913.1 VCBS repeat-containing protein [Gammaproteobacteria bacterium]MBT4193224.1 VCBS repeat-containing protein [Gammaproteobacteria bacterium]MBT4451065.1 VCBS repeat-containing protein [Gammaproteobacteria bacterium]MBT4862119.1 VCBS repeat-containing protein [Gammaproteobacteria bacterium]
MFKEIKLLKAFITSTFSVVVLGGMAFNSGFAATPGLPFTEDFSDENLKKATTTADWSIATNTAQINSRNAVSSGLNSNDVSSYDISDENKLSWNIKSADLNGDGYPDVIQAHRSNATPGYLGVSIHMHNNDSVGFYPQGIPLEDYTASSHNILVNDIDVGDVDQDGDIDIVVALKALPGSTFPSEQVGPSLLYLNDGSQTAFSGVEPLQISPQNEPTTSIRLVDLNCDGYLDVIAGNGRDWRNNTYYGNRFYLSEGGTTLFSNLVTGTLISTDTDDTTSIGVAYINDDAFPDLVALNSSVSKTYLHSGDCNAPFSAATLGTAIGVSNTAGEDLDLGDINNDGLIDAVYSLNGINKYVLNTGSGFDAAATPQSIGSDDEDSQSIRLADLDSDGDLDVLTANYGSRDVVYLNSGTNIPFDSSTPTIFLSNDTLNSTGIDVMDHDLDGNFDAVVSIQGLNRIYINGSTGELFSDLNATDIGQESSKSWTFDYADIDNDGDLDLVAADNWTDEMLIYFNDGSDDPFSSYINAPAFPVLDPAGSTIDSIVLEDINGDGLVDILVGTRQYPISNATLFTNSGTYPYFSGTGTVVATADRGDSNIYTQVYTSDFAVGDIDHDGDKDVVIGTYHRDMILVNNGTAAPFSDANQVILPTVDGTDSLQLGDMNNDGLLDLVVGNGTSVSPSTTKNYYYNPWCI